MFNFFKKRKKEPKNLKEVISTLSDLSKKVDLLSKDLKDLEKENTFHFQKFGIVRFNPFSDVGGNQSFSIALLDANDNGIVITSLYDREKCRLFAKPIKKGESKFPLSKEEKEVIKLARKENERNKKPKNNNSSPNSSSLGAY
ncbi:DUF4446 family protein [bacterium]|nr:DUF4446 family protein [bacterium]